MKIGKIELTTEKMVLLAAGLLILAALTLDAVFYLPLAGKLKTRYIECKNCENAILDTRNLIESAGKNCPDVSLMTEKEIPLAIEELTNHGKSQGISFISMRPREAVMDKTSNYKVLPIEMEIEAGDKQFAQFLGTLDELKKTLVKIKRFDIAPLGEDRARVRASITLDVYLSAGENAE